MKKFWIPALIILLLNGCGPVYQMHYRYVAPNGWRARNCINQCLNNRTQCQIAYNQQNQNCRTEADISSLAANAISNNSNDPYFGPSPFPDYSNCNAGGQCQQDYVTCYANCGGEVIITKTCVQSCPQPGRN